MFNHHQLPRASRPPFGDSKGGSQILTRAIAKILVALPIESSFLSVFFQKEATIMRKIRCNNFDAKPPQPAQIGLSLLEHFVALNGVSSARI